MIFGRLPFSDQCPSDIFRLSNIPCEYNIAPFPLSRKVITPNFYPKNKNFPARGISHQVAALPHPFTQNWFYFILSSCVVLSRCAVNCPAIFTGCFPWIPFRLELWLLNRITPLLLHRQENAVCASVERG